MKCRFCGASVHSIAADCCSLSLQFSMGNDSTYRFWISRRKYNQLDLEFKDTGFI